jgi:cyclopropane-fatty-acyl-phospholipid synthase
LISAEKMFRTGAQMVFQMQLAHKRDAVPVTRDYIADRQHRFRAWEAEREGPIRGTAASGD